MKKIKLKDLSNIFRGRYLPSTILKKSGEILYLTGRNIQNGEIVSTDRDRFLNEEKKYSKWILKPGDIIVTSLWIKRKIYQYKKSDPPSIVGGNWIILRTNHNEYLSKYFEIEDFYNQFELDCQSRLNGEVIPYLSLGNFLEIEIFKLSEKELLKKYDKQRLSKIGKPDLLNSINKNNLESVQKEFLKKLIDDYFEDPVIKLSKQYENSHLEHKSSFKKDIEHGGKIPEYKIINGVIKTIGGFCNTGGGDLLIGVSDDRDIIGIEVDGFDNDDKFLQSLTQQIGNNTKPDVMNLPGVIDISLHKIEEKTVCRVNVEPTPENIWVTYKNEKFYYKRKGPKTVSLKNDELIDYVEQKKELYN